MSSPETPSPSATPQADFSPGRPGDGPATHARFVALLFLCLAATTAYVCRNSIGVAEEAIRLDLGVTKQQMGWMMSAFFGTYAFLQIPMAWLGQKLGSRLSLSLYSLAWSLSTAAMALAGNFVGGLASRLGIAVTTGGPILDLAAARMAGGVAQAGLFPTATMTIYRWFPMVGRAMATGSLGSFMSAGGALGVMLTGYLLEQDVGWRNLFAYYGAPGVLWAIAFYLWFRNDPAQHHGVNAAELRLIRPEGVDEAEPEGVTKEPTPWLGLLSSPAMWLICLQQFCRAAPYMFFASWFATYLKETRGVSTGTSGFLNMLPLLGVVLGGLSGGIVSDAILHRTGSRRLARQGVAVVSLTLCALLILAAYFVQAPLPAVLLISAGSFSAALAAPCGYTITIDMGGRHVAIVHSTMNMCGNIGAMAFPSVVPWVLRVSGSWNYVLFLFGGMYLASAVFWLLLQPNGTIFDQSLIRPAAKEPAS